MKHGVVTSSPFRANALFGYRPYVSAVRSDHDALRSCGLELSLSASDWAPRSECAGVYKKLNFFDTSVGPVRRPFYVKQSHRECLSKTRHCSSADKQRQQQRSIDGTWRKISSMSF